MKKSLVLLFSLALFSSSSFAAWSWAGVASSMEGYNQAERQRKDEEAIARQNKIDQWRFEQEKRQHEESERIKAQKIAKENESNDIQTLIDQNSILKNWQLNSPEKWKQAIEYDDFLRASDEYKNLSLENRFNKVARDLSIKFANEAITDAEIPPDYWVSVGQTYGEIGSFYYINKQTISIEKNNRLAWVLVNYSKTRTDNGLSYSKTKTLWMVNCKKKKMGSKRASYFLKNEVVKSLDSADIPKMVEVVPDSIGESMLQMICAYKK